MLNLISDFGVFNISHPGMYSIGEGGSGSSHPPGLSAVGKEEPSMREEWLEKIGDIRWVDYCNTSMTSISF